MASYYSTQLQPSFGVQQRQDVSKIPPAYSLDEMLSKSHGQSGPKTAVVKEFQEFIRMKAKPLWFMMADRDGDGAIERVLPISWPAPIDVQVSYVCICLYVFLYTQPLSFIAPLAQHAQRCGHFPLQEHRACGVTEKGSEVPQPESSAKWLQFQSQGRPTGSLRSTR
jgi:hypothetical protein